MIVTEHTEVTYTPRVAGNRALPADEQITVDLELPTAARRNRWTRSRYQVPGDGQAPSFITEASADEIIGEGVQRINNYIGRRADGTQERISTPAQLLESRAAQSAALVRELVNVLLFSDDPAGHDELTETPKADQAGEDVKKNS